MATIRYLVHDVDAALDFYVGKLGFTLTQRWGPPFAMVSRGDLTLWLSGPGTSASRPMPDGAQPVPGGWNRLVLEVSDLDAKVSKLRESGVRMRSDIVTGPGGRQLVIDDPSGNPVELFEPKESSHSA
jgi:catechol 2,3-dioxygenase-like lactoylglutathione lyase family enzyme